MTEKHAHVGPLAGCVRPTVADAIECATGGYYVYRESVLYDCDKTAHINEKLIGEYGGRTS
jgi:hypothetical protein